MAEPVVFGAVRQGKTNATLGGGVQEVADRIRREMNLVRAIIGWDQASAVRVERMSIYPVFVNQARLNLFGPGSTMDEQTKSRVAIESIASGLRRGEMPPFIAVELYGESGRYRVIDGFHRVLGHEGAGILEPDVLIIKRPGATP